MLWAEAQSFEVSASRHISCTHRLQSFPFSASFVFNGVDVHRQFGLHFIPRVGPIDYLTPLEYRDP